MSVFGRTLTSPDARLHSFVTNGWTVDVRHNEKQPIFQHTINVKENEDTINVEKHEDTINVEKHEDTISVEKNEDTINVEKN